MGPADLTLHLILVAKYRAGEDADAIEERAIRWLVNYRGLSLRDAGREAMDVVQRVVADVDGATGGTP